MTARTRKPDLHSLKWAVIREANTVHKQSLAFLTDLPTRRLSDIERGDYSLDAETPANRAGEPL